MRLPSLGLVLLLASNAAADWPQFLGPTRDNVSTETIPVWSGELKPVWTQKVGPAHSSPVVANGVVYVFAQPGKAAADSLAAYDARTGEKKWERSYEREEFSPPFGAGPRSTPTVADGKVYTLGGTGVLACWDAADGKVLWKVDTLKQYKVENLTFGVSGSPLVAAGKVFVNVGGKGAGVVAFDAATGQEAWKATDDGASYSSPIAAGTGDAAQVIVLTKQNLLGLNPGTGDVYWKVPFRDRLSESATAPVVAGDLLVGSSVTLGSVALRMTTKDGKPAVEPAWRKGNLNCYFSTPAAVGDDLYMFNGVLSITPSITLRCVEAKTGKVRWEKPDVGKYHAALVRTKDGKLLMLDDNGYLALVQPDPAGYKQLCRSRVCGPTWAHPAVAGGRVYLRDEKELFCLEPKPPTR
jgi:outer membrane protein assembly factor BamB